MTSTVYFISRRCHVSSDIRNRIIRLANRIRVLKADAPMTVTDGTGLTFSRSDRKEKVLNNPDKGQTSLLDRPESLEEAWGDIDEL